MKDEKNNQIIIEVKKAFKIFSENYYDKRKFPDDSETNVWCGGDGYKCNDGVKVRVSSVYNSNILGYLITKSFAVNYTHLQLTRHTAFDGNGFYLRRDNFVEKLPLFCAKLYPQTNWFERDVYFTTSDGGLEYTKDAEFLKSCLIFTCLSASNHCRSFLASDGRWYYNELCLLQETFADEELQKFQLNENDNEIIKKWKLVLNEAQKIKPDLQKWGLYQIKQEIMGKKKTDKKSKNQITIHGHDESYYYATTEQETTVTQNTINTDCGNLNSLAGELEESLKKYYAKNIQEKLFKYQLLK